MSLLEVSGLSKTYTTRFGGAKVEGVSFGLLTQGKITGRGWLDGDDDGLRSETAPSWARAAAAKPRF